jgi:hypothetical protein
MMRLTTTQRKQPCFSQLSPPYSAILAPLAADFGLTSGKNIDPREPLKNALIIFRKRYYTFGYLQ